jgi:uncharacterized protein (TIGR02217 family)
VARFKDIYAPSLMLDAPYTSAPRFLTQIVSVASGDEQANQQWAHPLWKFMFPETVRTHSVFAAVRNHWLIMRGPFHTWPFRDALDFATVELETPLVAPTVSETDQIIGTGDGSETAFQLTKTYTIGDEEYVRKIYLPVLDENFRVAVDGVQVGESAYYVTRPGGMLHLDVAPSASQAVTWGGYFDCLVRFATDDIFQGIVQTANGIAGLGDLELSEVRYCADEDD